MQSDSNEFQTLQLMHCIYLTECQMTENINKGRLILNKQRMQACICTVQYGLVVILFTFG